MIERETEVIVVGTGAGGATIARELARKGKRVLMLERGTTHRRFFGTLLGAAQMLDKFGASFSRELMQAVRAITTGGSTMVYCGTCADPPPFIKEKLGIDLSEELAEARAELGATKLPERLLGVSSIKLMEAANSLGYNWEPLDKFIDPERCEEGCSDCMLVCPRDAKWTGRRYVDEAIAHGAELLCGVDVRAATHQNGVVTGVRGLRRGRPVEYRAPLVIVAAGGLSSAPILMRSGLYDAGDGIFIDPLVMVYGRYDGPERRAGSCWCPPMTVGTWEFQQSHGFMLSPVIDPWFLFLAQMMTRLRLRHIFKVFQYRRIFAVMVKIKDDMDGRLYLNGSFSKPLSWMDRKKLDTGAAISEEILIKAGCHSGSIVTTLVRGAHPGGSCRIGLMVDKDLETPIKGLYVSDASVFPEALGTPPVTTVVSMNKRLARHLLAAEAAAVDSAETASG